jgi:hypothetical protein
MTSLIFVTNGWENFVLTLLRTFLFHLTAETVPAVHGVSNICVLGIMVKIYIVLPSGIGWRTPLFCHLNWHTAFFSIRDFAYSSGHFISCVSMASVVCFEVEANIISIEDVEVRTKVEWHVNYIEAVEFTTHKFVCSRWYLSARRNSSSSSLLSDLRRQRSLTTALVQTTSSYQQG